MKPQTLILRIPDENDNPSEAVKGKLQICYFENSHERTSQRIWSVLSKGWQSFVSDFHRGYQIEQNMRKQREEMLLRQAKYGLPPRFF